MERFNIKDWQDKHLRENYRDATENLEYLYTNKKHNENKTYK